MFNFIYDIYFDLKWKLSTWLQKKAFKDMNNLARITAGVFEVVLKDGQKERVIPDTEHPLHKSRLKEVRSHINSLHDGYRLATMNVGDSITHLTETQVAELFEIFAPLSGSVAFHIQQMLKGIHATLKKKRIHVPHLCIGTITGNQDIPYERWSESEKDLIATLNLARKLLPDTTITYYAYPPAYNLNIIKHAFHIEALAVEWALADGNANVISLKKMGGGFFGLFATTKYSSDGIHLTPRGGYRLRKAFKKALTGDPGQYILA